MDNKKLGIILIMVCILLTILSVLVVSATLSNPRAVEDAEPDTSEPVVTASGSCAPPPTCGPNTCKGECGGECGIKSCGCR